MDRQVNNQNKVLLSIVVRLVLISRCLNSCQAAGLVCNSNSSVPSIWIRNRCQNRLVTSHGRKYVRAKAGLNPYDKKAEIIRESCNGHSDMIEERPGPVLTRLFFKNIQKYVCFDRCGRLRTKRDPDRYCEFIEHFLPPFDVMYELHGKKSWYLGFYEITRWISVPIKYVKLFRIRKKSFWNQKCQFKFEIRQKEIGQNN